MKNYYNVNGETTVIYLNRKDGSRLETIIDTAMLLKANEFHGKWYPHWNPHTNTFYVYGMNPQVKGEKRTVERLHRWLMNNPEGLVVDHINHDSLDNRKENLRAVTNAENLRNRRGLQPNNKSGVPGVYWYKEREKWMAQFVYNRNRIFVGYFEDIEEARMAISLKRKELEEIVWYSNQ